MGKPLVATRSKLVGGILYFFRFKEANRHSLSDVKQEQHNFNRHGAGAARRAHNPEVTRSKRVAGIIHHSLPVFQDTKCTKVRLRDLKQSGYGLIENMRRSLVRVVYIVNIKCV